MAIKKSELYKSLWASCDELRSSGSMDASQYKDYVLVMLFIKYISDRYAGKPYSPIKVPNGSTFQDMVKLKGNPKIGDLINTQIIAPIAEANKLTEMPDFNNPDKLGTGKAMVDMLTKLILIFEESDLDFRSNRADGDDILGDAYEYLMKHFASQSGKSKGEFYTPSEVSRIMAKIIGITPENSTSETSVYDPTAGSGSLLLKVANESEKTISIFGQEKETTTAGLARMNMILHNNPTAVIRQGNTIANPLFMDANSRLKTFDYVVSNPPFSSKSWGNGVNIEEELKEGGRFYGYGAPPTKNGDYAFLLHVVKSLKSKGKGTIILPHGVLFRGNAEAEIRTNLIRKGIIKGIIGLPPNLFYGTGIPACIIVLDKEGAEQRKGIFMIDAGKSFVKDGNKNRLREQDIHKIVDTFNKQDGSNPKYARMVSLAEIEEKEFNLNIPRYIDSTEAEDIQNIEAHLMGDIPNADIDALQNYWAVYPSLRTHLFGKSKRDGFSKLNVAIDEIKKSIFSHREFTNYAEKVNAVFTKWKNKNTPVLKSISAETKPKQLIHELSEDLLHTFSDLRLIDKYDVYQYLMSYWLETMQDDCYLIVADGWMAGSEVEFKGKEYNGRLIPKHLLIGHYFADYKKMIEEEEAKRDTITAQLQELEEEHGGEDGYFAVLDKVSKSNVYKRLKELKGDKDAEDEMKVLTEYLELAEKEAYANKGIKAHQKLLDEFLIKKYSSLTEKEIIQLVVDDKWIATIEDTVKNEMQRISQRLTQRIKELAERYQSTMPQLIEEVNQWEEKVNAHLEKMGFAWS